LWHYGRPRQPKIVVLAYFGGNDLLDNEFFAAHFAAGQSRLDYVYQKHSPGDFLVSLHLLLALRAALGPAPATDCHYPLSSAARPPTPLAFFDRLLPQLATGKATLANSDGWQRARASISAMNQALTDQGGRLALLYIPQKAELYWQDLAAADKQKIVEALRAAEVDAEGSLSVAAIDNHIGAQAELLKDFTAQQGIAMLDTRPALRAAIAAGEQPYFFADTHWNQRGHDIARNVLREFLNRSTLEE